MLRWIRWLMATMTIVLSVGCGGGGGGPSDTTPPSITDVQINPSSLIEPGRQVTVQAKVTDEGSGVQSVSVLVNYPDGTEKIETMSAPAGSNTFSVSFVAQWNAGEVGTDSTQWVVIKVQAKDWAGNQAESSESRIRAAASPPLPPF